MSQEDFFFKKRKTKRRFYSQRVITGLGGTSKERLKPLTHNCSIKNGETVYPGTVTGLDSLWLAPPTGLPGAGTEAPPNRSKGRLSPGAV